MTGMLKKVVSVLAVLALSSSAWAAAPAKATTTHSRAAVKKVALHKKAKAHAKLTHNKNQKKAAHVVKTSAVHHAKAAR